ncbi:MAG: AAA domain-containing protein [Sphingobacterium hotanense]
MSLKRELIYIDDKDETHRVSQYSYKGDKISVVFKNSNKEFLYSKNRAKIVGTAITSDKAFNVFNYLHTIANSIGLKTDDGDNILLRSYQNIQHISKKSVLASFLNGTLSSNENTTERIDFFPFGFNLSQKNAVNTAFSNNLSVIEGPPGTGKTQTILNIIVNAVLRNQSVAIVSSNNSATRNVYEKLEKNGIEFIAALLGNTQNKKDFIDSQKQIPDLAQFDLTESEKSKLKEKALLLSEQLSEMLDKKNRLALLKLQIDNIETEYEHFKENYKNERSNSVDFKSKISSRQILRLWITLESFAKRSKKVGFISRLLFRFKYGIKDKSFYENPLHEMIFICQSKYYPTKLMEITNEIESLESALKHFAFDSKMKEYTDISMRVLKAELFRRYYKQKRNDYTIPELKRRSKEFIKDYPVIMSTTYSLRQSLSDDISYDYVIIDESSQVDLATGALAVLC